MEAEAGETVMAVSVAALTVMPIADEDTPLEKAVTVVLPSATPVTTPLVLPTLAMAGAAEVQLTVPVMLAVEPSEYVPVAVRFAVRPWAMAADAGVMAMAVSTGAVTLTVAVFEILPPNEAVIVVLPNAKPVTIPLGLTVATAVSLETQVTEPEMLPVVPSE